MFVYTKLWKVLLDKKMTREQLRIAIKLSPSTIAKMGKDEYVAMEVLDRICAYLNCQPGDLIEYIPNPPADEKE